MSLWRQNDVKNYLCKMRMTSLWHHFLSKSQFLFFLGHLAWFRLMEEAMEFNPPLPGWECIKLPRLSTELGKPAWQPFWTHEYTDHFIIRLVNECYWLAVNPKMLNGLILHMSSCFAPTPHAKVGGWDNPLFIS